MARDESVHEAAVDAEGARDGDVVMGGTEKDDVTLSDSDGLQFDMSGAANSQQQIFDTPPPKPVRAKQAAGAGGLQSGNVLTNSQDKK